MIKPTFSVIILTLLLSACTPARYAATPKQQYYEPPADPITTSLFSSPEGTISEENIQRILDGEIVLPERMRLAVLQLEGSRAGRYYYGSEAYRNQRATLYGVLDSAARASDRTQWVRLLPQLLVSPDRNVFTLRESAVRMQADALLLYGVSSDMYSEFKLFDKDEAKAYASVEGLVLDIRTGVIVFVHTAEAEARGTRLESDTGQEDFFRRLRLEAERGAVDKLAAELQAWLR